MRLSEALLIVVIIGFELLLGVYNDGNHQKYDSLIADKYFAGNLTSSENERNVRRCGARFQPNIWRAKREVMAKEKEYPWTVLIKGPLRHCSGALISTRHVITSAYCVTKRLDNRRFQLVKTTETFVYPALKNPLRLRLNTTPFKVVKITIHLLYNLSFTYADLALLEISPNMLAEGLLICMPTENEEVPKDLTTTRFYYSLEASPAYYLEAINFTLNATDEANHRLIAVNDDHLCLRDIGGPLFKVKDGKYTLLGVTTANKQCRALTGYTNLFDDVRYFVDWVCQNSGVCPVKRRP